MVRSKLASWKWQLHLAWLFTSQDCFHTCLIALSEPELSSTNLTCKLLAGLFSNWTFGPNRSASWMKRKFLFWIQKYGSWQRLMLFLMMRYQCDNFKVRGRSEAFKLFPESPLYFIYIHFLYILIFYILHQLGMSVHYNYILRVN